MGNITPTTIKSQLHPINDTYFLKIIKGTKQEIDAYKQIQCIVTYQMYLQWMRDYQKYKQKIKKSLNTKEDIINKLLLLPMRIRYQDNGNLCGNRQGKVIFEYSNTFLTLLHAKQLHMQQNTPFTSFQIWNLLFTLIQFNIFNKSTEINLYIHSESIYVNLQTSIIKLLNPYSFIGQQLHKSSNQKYIDPQKLQLLIRKLKISNEIQSKNEDFNIGMIIAEIMLLESLNIIYNDGLTSTQQSINSTLHQLIVKKILNMTYYPLKLRIIIAGLIRLQSKQRFTMNQIYMLLKEFKINIHNFQSFHLRKTSFENCFGQKLSVIQSILSKIKKDHNFDCFNHRITLNQPKNTIPIQDMRLTTFGKRDRYIEQVVEERAINDQSLIFSMTNLGQTNRLNHQSLMFSQSLNKSDQAQLQRDYYKNHFLNLTNPIQLKTSNNKHSTKSLKSPQIQQPSIQNQPSVPDPFEQFAAEQVSTPEKQEYGNNLSEAKELSKLLHTAKGQDQKLSRSRSNSLKAFEQKHDQALQQLYTLKDMKASGNLDSIESQKKIKIQGNSKESQQGDISLISPTPQEEIQCNLSRNSQVAEYVSQLYEAPRQTISQITVNEQIPLNIPNYPKEIPSSRPKELLIRKTQSYEYQANSRDSVVLQHGFNHRSSIIDQLTPLVASKKQMPKYDDYNPDKLTEAAKKRIQYWNTFTKFSPEVIAQLHLPTKFPKQQILKRSMRQTISLSDMMVKKSRQSFPQIQKQHQINQSPLEIDNSTSNQ